jgi:ribosomal protein S18 acetylase RimI-like enzyme
LRFAAASIEIQPLRRDHDRAAFECGNLSLDNYLRQQARQDGERGVARVFVATRADSPKEILGYYALSAAMVARAALPDDVSRRLPRHAIPAAQVGRLAVDRRNAGRGLGKILLADALLKSDAAAESMAVALIVVDPIDQVARSFYRSFGFRELEGLQSQMFLMRGVGKSS